MNTPENISSKQIGDSVAQKVSNDNVVGNGRINMINVGVELQNPCDSKSVPSLEDLTRWCKAALQPDFIESKKLIRKSGESGGVIIVIRVVDDDEGLELNKVYRQKSATTNILSFAYDIPEELLAFPDIQNQPAHLGDLVICNSVVNKEAKEQQKTLQQHWAHLIIHGVLHLQGYDHIEDQQAEDMEALEITTLQQLGFKNPYT